MFDGIALRERFVFQKEEQAALSALSALWKACMRWKS